VLDVEAGDDARVVLVVAATAVVPTVPAVTAATLVLLTVELIREFVSNYIQQLNRKKRTQRFHRA
jgi:hypothetical protein